MTLFKGTRCYHLSEVVSIEKMKKKIFSGGKTSFFIVDIANFIHYFIFM